MLFTSIESLYQDIRRRLIIEESTSRDQIYRDLDSFGFEPRSYRHAKELWRSLMLDILMAIQPYYNMLKNNHNDNNRNYRRHVHHHHRHQEMKEDHDYQQIPRDRVFINEQVRIPPNVRVAAPVESEQEEFTRLVGQIAPQVFNALFTAINPVGPPPPPPPPSSVPNQPVPIGDINFAQILEEALRQTTTNPQPSNSNP